MKNKRELFFQLVYGLILFAECIALFKSMWVYYDVFRILTTLILFLYINRGDKVKIIGLYLYAGLAIVLAADILTLFCNGFLYYVGLNLFTFSYLSFAALFYRCRQVEDRKKIPPILITLAVTDLLFLGIFHYISEIKDIIMILQFILNTIILIVLFVWALKVKKNKDKNVYFLISAIFIILANICFGIALYQSNQYVTVRVLVVLFHGLYLLSLSKAVNRYQQLK